MLCARLARWCGLPEPTLLAVHRFDDWFNDTAKLFSLFRSLSLPSPWPVQGGTRSLPQSCVVYKTNNISPRHRNSSVPYHHPSTVNGAHHWLNRMSVALARHYGFGIVDLSATTTSLPAVGADTSLASEGDPYHGCKRSGFRTGRHRSHLARAVHEQ